MSSIVLVNVLVHSPPPVSTTDPISSLNLSVINNSAAMCLLNASTVTITCNTNSFPRPSVRFLKGQEFITPGVGAFQRVSQTFVDQVGGEEERILHLHVTCYM